MEKVRLPLTSDSLTTFVKILWISVLKSGVILVAIVICGDKDPDTCNLKNLLLECVSHNAIGQY